MLSKEQLQAIKEQLFSQIENLPPEQKESIKYQIEQMNDEQFEEFLIKNNLIKNTDSSDAFSGESGQETGQESNNESSQTSENNPDNCIFCFIKDGKIPSSKIYEDDSFLVVLEINPLSKGHSIIIPKLHLNSNSIKNDPSIIEISKTISQHIKEKLPADKVELLVSEMFGHAIINLIPINGDGKLSDLKRVKADQQEIEQLQVLLKYDSQIIYSLNSQSQKEDSNEKENKENFIEDNSKETKENPQNQEKQNNDNKEEENKHLSKEEIEEIQRQKEREEISKLPKYPRRIP